SPTTGIEPTGPNWKTTSAAPAPSLLRRNQVAVLGSKTPMVTWPSSSQSPTTGMLPRGPKAKLASAGPGPVSNRRNQVAVWGSKATTPHDGCAAGVAAPLSVALTWMALLPVWLAPLGVPALTGPPPGVAGELGGVGLLTPLGVAALTGPAPWLSGSPL